MKIHSDADKAARYEIEKGEVAPGSRNAAEIRHEDYGYYSSKMSSHMVCNPFRLSTKILAAVYSS